MNLRACPLSLLAAALLFACSTPGDPAEAPSDTSDTSSTKVAGESHHLFDGLGARISPDGHHAAFHRTAGEHLQIFLADLTSGDIRQLTDLPGDARDPSWLPDSRYLVFAANHEGSFDLYETDLDARAPIRLTDLPGDATEPTVSPLHYSFFAVYDDGCSPEPTGRRVDAYGKVVFTYRHADSEEIHFASLQPRHFEPTESDGNLEPSDHGEHTGRISPQGQRCRQPAYSGDGLHLTFVCDGETSTVHDGPARWDTEFADAVEAIGHGTIPECTDSYHGPQHFDWQACLQKLPRRYTRHDGEPLPADFGLHRPAYSANHTMIVADDGDHLLAIDRFTDTPRWSSLARNATNATWYPSGAGFTYEDGSATHLQPTDMYLQSVTNLHLFPELVTDPSELLPANRFVVREGATREFYALYETLRYERRPQFVTADATLQVFRDEFLRLLEKAEERAAHDLLLLTEALAAHYLERARAAASPQDEYLALYFTLPSLYLRAAANLTEDREPPFWGEPPHPPVLEDLPDAARELLPDVADSLRPTVEELLEATFDASGFGELPVPGLADPAPIDFTQFIVRGNYAENDLAGYFMAMIWFAQAPLPFDESLAGLTTTMANLSVGDRTALERWESIDALVGSFMGRPVDATILHVRQTFTDHQGIFKPFDTAAVRDALEELRGPVAIRDLATLVSEDGERILKVTFFPQRQGLDTTYFRGLTYPDAGPRPFPSSLDVMAVLGAPRAKEHALAAAANTAWEQAYRDALNELIDRESHQEPAYFSTDLYHSWLAVLATLARSHDIDDASLFEFTPTDAWQDRLLSLALSGYTQLKHTAVLYNAQDYSAECGGEVTYRGLVEQPILPRPRGFVDPMPTFFTDLATLSRSTYDALNQGYEPLVRWHWEHDQTTVANLADRLARIARDQLDATPLSDDDLAFIEFIGAHFEALTIGLLPDPSSIQIHGEGRAQRGVALATDIHTNAERQEVLQIAIGPVHDLYAIIPDGVGDRLTQGGVFSFFEFTQPASQRLTDDEWNDLLDTDDRPRRPSWTDSFIEAP